MLWCAHRHAHTYAGATLYTERQRLWEGAPFFCRCSMSCTTFCRKLIQKPIATCMHSRQAYLFASEAAGCLMAGKGKCRDRRPVPSVVSIPCNVYTHSVVPTGSEFKAVIEAIVVGGRLRWRRRQYRLVLADIGRKKRQKLLCCTCICLSLFVMVTGREVDRAYHT